MQYSREIVMPRLLPLFSPCKGACWVVLLLAGLAMAQSAPTPQVTLRGPKAGADVKPDDPYSIFCKSVYFSARRGAKWLQSAQRPDGLFVYGWIPSLNRPLPGDNALRQAGAVVALARAAAVIEDEPEYELAAQQALLVLINTATQLDPKDPQQRRPTLPAAEAHPVGFAALLLLAISELPRPGEKLVEQGEQLARFLAARQRPDGSFNLSGNGADGSADVAGGIDFYPGEALYALLRSNGQSPAPWKLEVVKKAFGFYRQYWREHPSAAFIPWQSSAFSEAYLLTQDYAYAEFVFEMNDWLLQMQYLDPDTTPDGWLGGFGSYEYGHILRTTPGATTASFAEGLVDAWRVAKLAGDTQRQRVYRVAVETAFEFLMRNQYSTRSATHYEHWFREKLNGAFHASAVDGTVRIDFTQHACCAMLHYLTHVADHVQAEQQSPNVGPNVPANFSDAPKAN